MPRSPTCVQALVKTRGSAACTARRAWAESTATSTRSIFQRGGTRQLTIAERAGVTKQSVGPIVRELETLGYVRTQPDPNDRRATLVSLTPAGRRAIDTAQPLIDQIEDNIRSQLGESAFDTLVGLLGKLLACFDEGDAYPQH